MHICISKEQFIAPNRTPSVKNNLLSSAHNSRHNMDFCKPIRQSIESYQGLHSDFHNPDIHIKDSLSDSILIQDKQNCYIPNRESIRQKVPMCCNHSKEKAEFLILSEGGQVFTYCHKCSSMLASQGFCIQRISSHNIQSVQGAEHSRKSQLDELWSGFSNLYEQVMHKKNRTDFSVVSYQSFYNQQIQEINIYFDNLYVSLEALKNKFYNSILSDKEQATKKHQEWSNILGQLIRETEAIEADIQGNQEGVVTLNSREYQELIEALSQHLKEYGIISSSWKLEQIQLKKLSVPPIDSVVQSIKNLVLGQQTTTPRLPRSSLFCHNPPRDNTEESSMGQLQRSNSCMFVQRKSMFSREMSALLITQ